MHTKLGMTDKWRLQKRVHNLADSYVRTLLNGPYCPSIQPNVALDQLQMAAKALNDYNELEFRLSDMAENLLDSCPRPKARKPLSDQILDRDGLAAYDKALEACRDAWSSFQLDRSCDLQPALTALMMVAHDLKEADALINAAIRDRDGRRMVKAALRDSSDSSHSKMVVLRRVMEA